MSLPLSGHFLWQVIGNLAAIKRHLGQRNTTSECCSNNTLNHGTEWVYSSLAAVSWVVSTSAALVSGLNPVWSVYSMWVIFHPSPDNAAQPQSPLVFLQPHRFSCNFNPMSRKFCACAFLNERASTKSCFCRFVFISYE